MPRPTKAIRPMENRTLEVELAWHACCLPDSTLAAERDFEEEKRRASQGLRSRWNDRGRKALGLRYYRKDSDWPWPNHAGAFLLQA